MQQWFSIFSQTRKKMAGVEVASDPREIGVYLLTAQPGEIQISQYPVLRNAQSSLSVGT